MRFPPAAGRGLHRRARCRHGRNAALVRSGMGFTLVELLIGMAVVAILATIAHGQYVAFVERARIATAIADLSIMELEILRFQQLSGGKLPAALVDIQRDSHQDPWGRPYHYVNLRTTNKGAARKDRKLNPLNSDYDLFSAGKDGVFKTQISQKDSLDDVIRALDGAYIGVARDF